MEATQNLQILQLIQDTALPVGAVFLSQELNLPQATVGRMLLALEQQGYLRKISNKGRCITPEGRIYLEQQARLQQKLATAKNIIETAESHMAHKLHDVLEVRMVLEALSAQLATANMTPTYAQELDAIILEHRVALLNGDLGCEQDLGLHLKIAQIAGNEILQQTLTLLLTQENVYTKFSMVAPSVVSTQIQQHSAVVEALKSGNAQLAKDAMISHLRHVMNDVVEYDNAQKQSDAT